MSRATGNHYDALRDVPAEMLEDNSLALSPNVYRRCRHVISEIERTRKAVGLLKSNDLSGFGRLMAESHNSLRIDYEVSGEELDLLVRIARGIDGVLGSRMTGAGFGGCTVNLVQEDALSTFKAAVESEYHLKTGLEPELYVCNAVGGVGIAT